MTTDPLTFEEARRRLLSRKSERRTPLMSQSEWLNLQARKDPSTHYTKGEIYHPIQWDAEFKEMAERGLSRKEMLDELGLSWPTVRDRLKKCYNGHSYWPPLEYRNG